MLIETTHERVGLCSFTGAAIVYFDVPFISDYTFVNKRYLRPVDFAGFEKIAEYMEKERMWMDIYGNGTDDLDEPIDTTSAEWKKKVSQIVSPYDRLFMDKKTSRNSSDKNDCKN